MNSPAFLFYSKDWIADTADWEPESKGVYIDLLAHQHVNGSLPSDMRKLARVARLSPDEFKRVWEDIKHKFDIDGDHVVNHRLNQVVTENQSKAQKNKINGCFAAKVRSLNISTKQMAKLKSEFEYEMFTSCPDNEIKDSVYRWVDQTIDQMVNQVVNHTDNNKEDVNADVNANKNMGVKGGKSKRQSSIPSLEEFLQYAEENEPRFAEKKHNITMKYNSWVEDGWKNGRTGKRIEKWKPTLLNTLPYIPEIKTNGTPVPEYVPAKGMQR